MKELPLDRLGTTDEEGRRVWLYPSDVRGKLRSWRGRLSTLLIFVFLALPWLRVDGEQALWLDIAHGRFTFFGVTFWAQDLPALLLVIGGAVTTIAWVTAVWGRAWCGWACPQTVYTDFVYRAIERRIEGDSVERRRLDQAPWFGPESHSKFLKKSLKWLAFTLLSMVLAHSFLAYFIGTESLAHQMQSSPAENPWSFLLMVLITGLLLFDLGWFREQFCTLVCPYGRFQSVLMDERSVAVAYDSKRGEPRRAGGDCIDCGRCVQVCPTGIDIRRGLQMECVACTACIDACDEVMRRTKKPPRLIGFSRERAGIGPRAILLGGITLAMALGIAWLVWVRQPISLSLVRTSGAPYQELTQSGEVVNHFKLELRNLGHAPIRFELATDSPDTALVRSHPITELAPGVQERSDLFIKFPKRLLAQGKAQLQLRVLWGDGRSIEKGVALVGPYK